ncbi:unnamed protein product, partial [Nesidiocoris tenuis]
NALKSAKPRKKRNRIWKFERNRFKNQFSKNFWKKPLSYGGSSEKPGKNTQKRPNPRHRLQN